MQVEKRKYIRIPFKIEAALLLDGSEIRIDLIDLSLRGLLAGVKDNQLQPDSIVDIVLTIPNQNFIEPLKVKSRIIRSNFNSIGVQFIEMDVDTFSIIRGMVSYGSGHPEKVEEEIKAMIDRSESDI